MPAAQVIVLYEDKAWRCFGPHKLLASCVADEKRLPRDRLNARIDGRPLGGVDRLIATCRDDFEDITRSGHPVVAVVDGDRIAQHPPPC